jgi:hypothetical protein
MASRRSERLVWLFVQPLLNVWLGLKPQVVAKFIDVDFGCDQAALSARGHWAE